MKVKLEKVTKTVTIVWNDDELHKLARKHWFSGPLNVQGDREAFLQSVTVTYSVSKLTLPPESLSPIVTAMSAVVVPAVIDGSRPAHGRSVSFPQLSPNELSPVAYAEVLEVVSNSVAEMQDRCLGD